MYPVVFRIPLLGRDVPGYGLMLMIGFLVAIVWAARRAMRSGANPDVILNCGFIALIGGVVGARAMHVVHYWSEFAGKRSILELIWAIVDVTKGGLEYYGGFLLASISIILWLKFYERVSLRWYCDIMAPSAAIGLAFGRLGCFLNGCCYGATCEQPWALQFPYASPAHIEQWQKNDPHAALPAELIALHSAGVALPIMRESIAARDEEIAGAQQKEDSLAAELKELRSKAAAATGDQKAELDRQIRQKERALAQAEATFGDIREQMRRFNMSAAEIRALAKGFGSGHVHPTQLYSFVMATIVALMLSALYWRRSRDGVVTCTFFFFEPLSRIVLELIRADNPLDTFGLTISQFLALGMMTVATLVYFVLRGSAPRSPTATLWIPPEEPDATPRKPSVAR
ncbi:MAG: prolipoprotein diacylglyceryl transferase [Phycisphaerales bacterium]|nr:prolipoprotein diacylglyceryl transferase [Phycisphaerales bacterium]